ncbi:hypothetical protein [Cohnella sp. GCM10027633]|uniref:hypothetical protein n=1 Tax=unclassified Cohnella TaxID=2636738 RepID=UPI00363805A4
MTAETLQRRLDLLAQEAAERYPYYGHLQGPDVRFERLPLMDKATINDNRAQLERPPAGAAIIESHTSGSTGTPFRCLKTKEEQLALSMAIQRRRLQWGLPLNHRTLLIGNSLFADPRMVALYANQIASQSPHLVQGRCSGLYELAAYYERNKLDIPPSLACVQNWGEYVHPAQKEEIERIFGVPLLDYYGMEEIWMIAFTNPAGELEIDERHVFVEALDPGTGQPVPEGEIGELAVTSFVLRSLPFLRYRTGDLGRVTRGKGQRGAVLELLPMRQSHIKLRGKQVNASVLRFLDRFYQSLAADRGMKQFQLIQESYVSFILRVVADTSADGEWREEARKLEQLLKQCLLTDELTIAIERVAAIAPHPVSGKYQPFVSSVP